MVDVFDIAPAFTCGREHSDPFDFSTAPGKHQFCSEERWDAGVDRFLDEDNYMSELSSGLESWSSTDTEEASACGESLILQDFAASSHDTGSDAPAAAMANWSRQEAQVPQGWAAHHPMTADPYLHSAHRNSVLSTAYTAGNPALPHPAALPHGAAGIVAPALYHYGGAPYERLPFSAVVDFEHQYVGAKRLAVEFLDQEYVYEAFAPRPKSARISSKRTQDLLRIEAEAAASASAAAAVVSAMPPLPAPSSAAVLDRVNPSCCPPANRTNHLPCKTTILQCCKFTSKQTQQACKGQLTIVPHKRGHLAVSCSSRHQWVWCSLCCNCHAGAKGGNSNGRNRGCTVPTHWFERDAFDTGARNHMNVHKSGVTK